ncbi:hypothetical protein KIN20_035757 [Parelaphostrongylus tenuis]|uniref:Uncharacterized protein n=1 Tax=Parelaphostrongylus tenuis TaxID=148309 RepID=A0AAD5RBN3_PARTN|nr:hypothetical protein KIN20_035757 [Parelaphostrongylus tenuis]
MSGEYETLSKISDIHFLDKKIEQKTALKSSPDDSIDCWLLLVESAFCGYEDINGRSLYNRQNRRKLFRNTQQKSTIAKTMGGGNFAASVIVWSGICATARLRWFSSTKTSKSTLPDVSSKFIGVNWNFGILSTLVLTDLRFSRIGISHIWPT